MRTHGRKDGDVPITGAIEEEDDEAVEEAPRSKSNLDSEYASSKGFDRQWEKKKFVLNDNCKLEFIK